MSHVPQHGSWQRLTGVGVCAKGVCRRAPVADGFEKFVRASFTRFLHMSTCSHALALLTHAAHGKKRVFVCRVVKKCVARLSCKCPRALGASVQTGTNATPRKIVLKGGGGGRAACVAGSAGMRMFYSSLGSGIAGEKVGEMGRFPARVHARHENIAALLGQVPLRFFP